MLTRLAAFVIRFRWWVIGGWVVVFLVSVPFAPRVTSQLKHGFGDLDTESRAALSLVGEELDFTESSITLVFSSDSLDVDDPAYAEEVERAVAPLRQLPEVVRVVTYYTVPGDTFVADDRRTTYAFVELDASVDEAVDLVEPIRSSLGETELDVWVTGGIALFADLSTYSERDLQRAELITIPLLAILLLLVFGSVVAAGLPVAMGALSVVTTLALVFVVAQATDMSIFVLNIASFLGLGMAVDYSLLMVSRFREELQRADTVASAVVTTIETSGKAIVFSAGTSVIALSGLLFFDMMMMRSLGVGGITVILFSMLIALTLLPALFAVLGHRVDRLSIWRRRTARGGFWFTLSQWVMRHPIAVIIPTTAFLVLLGLPFLNVNLGSPWASILPEEAESRQGQGLVDERFGPGELSQVIIVESSPTSTLSPGNIAANLEFVERMENDPRVVRVDSIFGAEPRMTWEQMQQVGAGFKPAPTAPAVSDEALTAFNELVSDDLRTQMVRIVPRHSPTADETKALVSDIRSNPPGGDMTVLVTGITADQLDNVDSMYSDFPQGDRLRGDRHVRCAAAAVPVGYPATQGGGAQRAEHPRKLRCAGVRVPTGQLRGPAGLYRRWDHRGDGAHTGVLGGVRAEHGLRGVPAQPGERGIRAHRGQHTRCGNRHGAIGTDHHQRGGYPDRGLGRIRHRRHTDHQGARTGNGHCGPGRLDDRTCAAGARADARDVTPQLVGATLDAPHSENWGRFAGNSHVN